MLILKLICLISLAGVIRGQAYPEISYISKEKGKSRLCWCAQ